MIKSIVLLIWLNKVLIIRAKLEFKNKTFINKLNEIQKEYENEIRMITKINSRRYIIKDKIGNQLLWK